MRATRRRALGLAVVATLALAGCSTGGAANTNVTTLTYSSAKRPAAPDISGSLLDGGTFSLASQRGHVVVVNLWGSWCATCRVEAADLESVAGRNTAVFIGIDNRDDRDAATAYQAAHHITYPSIYDPAGHIALSFKDVPALNTPSTIVIDPQGRTAAIHVGVVSAAELTSMIAGASS